MWLTHYYFFGAWHYFNFYQRIDNASCVGVGKLGLVVAIRCIGKTLTSLTGLLVAVAVLITGNLT